MRTIWLPLILLGLALVACDRTSQAPATETTAAGDLATTPATSVASAVTRRPVVTPVTSTPTLTPTATRVPPTRIPISAPSPTSNVFALAELPTPDPQTVYRLHPPRPAEMVSLLGLVEFRTPRGCGMDSVPPCHQVFLLNDEPDAISRLIAHDITVYYPAGFPSAIAAVEELQAQTENTFPWPPRPGLQRILIDAIEEYFSGYTEPLIPGSEQETEWWDFTAYPVSLDNPDNPAWLLKIEIWQWSFAHFMLLKSDETGTFQVIPSELPTVAHPLDPAYEVSTEYDFTGDGVNEILISQETYLGGNSTEAATKVYTWDGEQLRLLERIEQGYFWSNTFKPVIEISDETGDGVRDIRLVTARAGHFGCEWQDVDIYSWPAGQPRHQMDTGEPPDNAHCNLWRGLGSRSTNSGHRFEADDTIEERLAYLERALNQFMQDTSSSSPDWPAFTRLHLVMTYIRLGRDLEAEQMLLELQRLSASTIYVQYLQENLERTDLPVTFCRHLVMDRQQALETELREYLSTAGLFGPYGIPERAFLPHLCPLQEVAQARLELANLSDSALPPSLLSKSDLLFAYAQPVNLDTDAEQEWIGVLEPEQPQLLLFDYEDGEWHFEYLYRFFLDPVTNLKLHQKDVTRDGTQDIVIVTTEVGSSERVYNVLLLTLVEDRYELLATNRVYEEEPVLADIDRGFFDLDRPAVPYWYTLEGYDTEEEGLWRLPYTLEVAVLENSSNAEAEIQRLLEYLPTDDPASQPAVNRLLYYLGYHYELTGREAEAVATYRQLLMTAPDSLWSRLAWMRLEPVPVK